MTNTSKRTRLLTASAGVLALITTGAYGCASPHQDSAKDLRATLVAVITTTGQELDVGPWNPVDGPSVEACGIGNVRFSYVYGAPEQPANHDREADAQTVAHYWASLGYDTRTAGPSDAVVVFASDADITSMSLQTGPTFYTISGTTRCAPGNVDDFDG